MVEHLLSYSLGDLDVESVETSAATCFNFFKVRPRFQSGADASANPCEFKIVDGCKVVNCKFHDIREMSTT